MEKVKASSGPGGGGAGASLLLSLLCLAFGSGHFLQRLAGAEPAEVSLELTSCCVQASLQLTSAFWPSITQSDFFLKIQTQPPAAPQLPQAAPFQLQQSDVCGAAGKVPTRTCGRAGDAPSLISFLLPPFFSLSLSKGAASASSLLQGLSFSLQDIGTKSTALPASVAPVQVLLAAGLGDLCLEGS